jgi:hypothetical protein
LELKLSKIKARKKLTALYQRGIELRFDENGGRIGPFRDEDGAHIPATENEVAIWVQAPSPLQREMAMREAQAKRARALLRTKRDEESEERLTTLAFLAEMDGETLIDYVLSVKIDDLRNEAIRDVLSREEWSDMTELRDAMRQFEESGGSAEDDEWKALMERDNEYGIQVAERQAELMQSEREMMRLLTRGDVEKRAIERRAELIGSQAFMFEYEKWMTYYSVRDPENHGDLFFDNVEDWSDQEDEIRERVAEALSVFIQDGADAKNLPRVDRG